MLILYKVCKCIMYRGCPSFRPAGRDACVVCVFLSMHLWSFQTFTECSHAMFLRCVPVCLKHIYAIHISSYRVRSYRDRSFVILRNVERSGKCVMHYILDTFVTKLIMCFWIISFSNISFLFIYYGFTKNNVYILHVYYFFSI